MTIYSRNNPPSGFYVYLYLREDGTPYYAGKGVGNRAWVSHRYIQNGKMVGVHTPKDLSRIIITHCSLTELWAFALERRHIRWYGRKDNETGILHNKTDGGEGCTGIIQTEIANKKRSDKLKGNPSTRKNYKTSDKTKEKLSVSMTGLVRTEQHKINNSKSNTGKKRTAEQNEVNRQRNLGINNVNYDHTVYSFIHKNGSSEMCTRNEFSKKYKIPVGDIGRVTSGKLKKVKGWSVKSDSFTRLSE